MRVNINGVWKQVKDDSNTPAANLTSYVTYGKAVVAYANSGARTTYYGIPIKSNMTVGQKYLAYGSADQTFIAGSNMSSASGKDSIIVPVPVYYESSVTQEMINKGYFYVGSSTTGGSGSNTTNTVNGITADHFAIVFLL